MVNGCQSDTQLNAEDWFRKGRKKRSGGNYDGNSFSKINIVC